MLVWEGLLTSNPKNKPSVANVFKQIMNSSQPNSGMLIFEVFFVLCLTLNVDGVARGLLVLLSAHFQTQQTHQLPLPGGGGAYASLAAVVRSILSIPVAIHMESLSQFASLFSDLSLFPVQLTFQLATQYPCILIT